MSAAILVTASIFDRAGSNLAHAGPVSASGTSLDSASRPASFRGALQQGVQALEAHPVPLREAVRVPIHAERLRQDNAHDSVGLYDVDVDVQRITQGNQCPLLAA